MYDYDTPEYGPGTHVEVWSGDIMIHEVERIWGWSDSWEIVKVDGIPWRDVPPKSIEKRVSDRVRFENTITYF